MKHSPCTLVQICVTVCWIKVAHWKWVGYVDFVCVQEDPDGKEHEGGFNETPLSLAKTSLAAVVLWLPVAAVWHWWKTEIVMPFKQPFKNFPATFMQRSHNAASGARAEVFPICVGNVLQSLWSAFDVTPSHTVTFMKARATFWSLHPLLSHTKFRSIYEVF